MRELVGADLASCTEVDLEAGTVLAVCEPFSDWIAEPAAALGRRAHQHPLIARGPSVSRAETISDYLSRRAFHRLERYAEVYRPLGAEDQLAVNLPARPERAIGIALNRIRERA